MTAAPEFRWQAVGRRKTSVARVYLTPGTGKWDINGRTLGDYFPRPSLVQHIQQPFTATDTLGAFDVKAHVNGGGQAGQAGALRLGDRAGAGGGRRAAPDQAARLRPADARPARGRAQEAGPSGRAEAVPVLEALDVSRTRGAGTHRSRRATRDRPSAPISHTGGSQCRVPCGVGRGDERRWTINHPNGRTHVPAWHSRNCRTCSRPASISATRPAAGTRRCAGSSSPSAPASTSSISRRRSGRSRRRRSCSASVVLKGDSVLFVCTKKQLKAIVQARRRALRRVLRHRALARRHAHQLPDPQEADPPPEGAGAGRGRRRLRELHQEGEAALRARAGEAEPQPRGHQA